jgi:hypothetical protein
MVAVWSRYARVAIMSGDAEDTMPTLGSKAICNRQRSGRNDLGVPHIHSFVREPEFCVYKLSSDPMDGIGLEIPRKRGGVSYVIALKSQRAIFVNTAQQALSWIDH